MEPPSTPNTTGKRKQPYASKACDICRTKKVKCDGNDPCSRCVQANIRCLHEMVQHKRGPTAGRIQELEEDLHFTQNELEQQKKKAAQLEEQLKLMKSNNFRSQNTAQQSNLGLSTGMATSVVVHGLLEYYRGFMYTFSGIPVPNIDLTDFLSQSAEPRSSMLFSTILAYTSLDLGDINYSRDMFQIAKTALQSHHDDIHPFTAATYLLLALYNHISSNWDTGSLYMRNAHAISKAVLDQYRRRKAIQLPIQENSLKLTESVYGSTLCRMLEETDSEIGMLALLNEAQTFQQLTSSFNKEFQQFSVFIGKLRYIFKGKTDLQHSLLLLDEAHLYIPSTCNPKMQQQFLAILLALRGAVYHLMRNRNLAVKLTDESLKLLRECEKGSISFASVAVLSVAGQVYFKENATERVLQVVQLLEQFSHLPAAHTAQQWLLDPEFRANLNEQPWTLIDLFSERWITGSNNEFKQFAVATIFPSLAESNARPIMSSPQPMISWSPSCSISTTSTPSCNSIPSRNNHDDNNLLSLDTFVFANNTATTLPPSPNIISDFLIPSSPRTAAQESALLAKALELDNPLRAIDETGLDNILSSFTNNSPNNSAFD